MNRCRRALKLLSSRALSSPTERGYDGRHPRQERYLQEVSFPLKRNNHVEMDFDECGLAAIFESGCKLHKSRRQSAMAS
jgi:hypothetical protein